MHISWWKPVWKVWLLCLEGKHWMLALLLQLTHFCGSRTGWVMDKNTKRGTKGVLVNTSGRDKGQDRTTVVSWMQSRTISKKHKRYELSEQATKMSKKKVQLIGGRALKSRHSFCCQHGGLLQQYWFCIDDIDACLRTAQEVLLLVAAYQTNTSSVKTMVLVPHKSIIYSTL